MPLQLVALEGLSESCPASGMEASGSVEAIQAETVSGAPAPSAGETEVRPTAPAASRGPQGAPNSQKKAAPPSEVRMGFLILLLIFLFFSFF